MIAKLIWLAGAATQMFAPGGKHSHTATNTAFMISLWLDLTEKLATIDNHCRPLGQNLIDILVGE